MLKRPLIFLEPLEWLQKPVAYSRRIAGDLVMKAFLNTVARGGRLHPLANPANHGVKLIKDIAYRDSGLKAHTLDIYIPSHSVGPRPVAIYVHGGAFRYLSKETHWIMALGFARQGFTVFNINYRLAPKHPFPAALEDTAAALRWVAENAADYEGDPTRIVLAGESAGANLITALSIATSYPQKEAWARQIWESRVRPSAVVANCGIHQVSNPERFYRIKKLPSWLRDRLFEPSKDYLPSDSSVDTRLADPVVFLEQGRKARRKLPPFLVSAGTGDPLLDDSRRLERALKDLNVPCEGRFYPGAWHAFHAMVWEPQAQSFWKTQLKFLQKYVGPLVANTEPLQLLGSLFPRRRKKRSI